MRPELKLHSVSQAANRIFHKHIEIIYYVLGQHMKYEDTTVNQETPISGLLLHPR